MVLAAQVAIYPLRQPHLSPFVGRAAGVFEKHGLGVEVGAMSTVLSGEADVLFGALEKVFTELAEKGELVMMVTFSNACPVGA